MFKPSVAWPSEGYTIILVSGSSNNFSESLIVFETAVDAASLAEDLE